MPTGVRICDAIGTVGVAEAKYTAPIDPHEMPTRSPKEFLLAAYNREARAFPASYIVY